MPHPKFLLSIVVVGITHLLFQLLLPQVIHPQSWISLLFLATLFTLVHVINNRIQVKAGDRTFITATFATIMLKLFSSIIFILVFLVQQPENVKLFVVNFFILYFLFSGFEMYLLIANLRHQKKN